MTKPDLSVVIPAYNEAQRLPDTLKVIYNYLLTQKFSWEIVVSDDGSTDQTLEIALAFKPDEKRIRVVEGPKNMGKGAATRRGMLAADGKYRLFTDADNSTPIEEFEKLFRAMKKEKAYIAIGSRALPKSELEIRQPYHREMMGRAFNKVVQILAIPGIKDTQCGFKLFREKAAIKLFKMQQNRGFSFDVEILYLARKYRMRVAEVPVRWLNNDESKVSPVRDSLRVLRDLIKIRIRYR